MGDRIVEVIIKAKDTTANAIGKFRRRMRGVEQTIKAVTRVVVASTAAIGAMVLGLTKLAERGDKVNAVKRAFARITGDETAALEKLRRSAQGTISDFELMAFHNQALTLGAADTTEAFAEMVEISRELGRAQGLDALQSLESLTTGLGRQSKLFLDNLGILLDTEKAYEDYAKSLGKTADQLTDNEKRTAFLTAAMEQARQKAADLRTETDGSTEASTRFTTAIQNLRDRLAELVAESPEVAAFFDSFTTVIEDLAEIVATGDTDLLKRAFTELGTIAGNAFSIAMQKAVSGTRDFVGNMVEALVRQPDENERRAMEDYREKSGGRRDIFQWLFDKIEGSLSKSAELAEENIRVSTAALAEIAAEARERAAATAAGGGGTGGGSGAGVDAKVVGPIDVPGVVRRRAAPSFFSDEALAFHQLRQDRKRRVRLGPAVMTPGSFGLAPGMISPGAPPGTDEQIDADTIRDGAKAMGEASQVVVASMFGMAQAAVRGSDQVAQSVVGMITQIAQSLPGVGGIFGTIIGGVGGLIGAAIGRNRDPVPVRIRDIDDAAARKWQNSGQPIRITTVTEVGGVEVERIERELIARQDRDQVVRYRGGTAVGV